eukprot:Skav207448  [mRNA]  locus=scaffold3545:15286:15891:+ [translate_table: standard]
MRAVVDSDAHLPNPFAAVSQQVRRTSAEMSGVKFNEYTPEGLEKLLARKRKRDEKQTQMACNVQMDVTQTDISSVKLVKEHQTAQDAWNEERRAMLPLLRRNYKSVAFPVERKPFPVQSLLPLSHQPFLVSGNVSQEPCRSQALAIQQSVQSSRPCGQSCRREREGDAGDNGAEVDEGDEDGDLDPEGHYRSSARWRRRRP